MSHHRRMKEQGKDGHQILVVDDEPSVCRAIKMLLEFDGHEVQTADSGEAALGIFAPGRFDLVITDYSMKEMKGDQLAALIKQRHPAQPIIMATAFAHELKAAGTLNGDVDFILNKPFSQADLREAIARVLR